MKRYYIEDAQGDRLYIDPVRCIDMHPEPVQQDEPSGWLLYLGAALGIVGVIAVVSVLFTLGGAA